MLEWTAARLGRPPRVVQAFITADNDRGDDAYLESVGEGWLRAGAASADDAGLYDRADAFLPSVCERMEAADVVFVPGGFPERAYDVLWGRRPWRRSGGRVTGVRSSRDPRRVRASRGSAR